MRMRIVFGAGGRTLSCLHVSPSQANGRALEPTDSCFELGLDSGSILVARVMPAAMPAAVPARIPT